MDKVPKVKKTENMAEYKKQYYQENKIHLNEIMLAEVICECGATSHRCNLPRHMKTKLHVKRLKLKLEVEIPKDIEHGHNGPGPIL